MLQPESVPIPSFLGFLLKSDNNVMQDGDCTHKSCQSFASAGTGIRLMSLPQPTLMFKPQQA